MTKKKQIILEAARLLFNEFGYSQVTIRMIALKLNMSSGNLNYHFKKREDIFEALYFEMVTEFDKRIKVLPRQEVSITQIRNDIENSMKRMVYYKFFWTDLYNLLSVSKKVDAHFQEVYKMRKSGCILLFDKMKKQDLMRDSSFELEFELLAERMIDHGNTWMYSSKLYFNEALDINTEKHVNSLLSMLYPYFTTDGKKEFRKLLPEFFV